jgi:deoxycytidylate deaminase
MASIEECTYDSSIYVTRYPCEACARAIVAAGIKHVYYGRQQEISDETKLIFATAGVEVVWVKTWTAEDILT